MTKGHCPLVAVLLVATLTGCAHPYYAVENNDTSVPFMWRTEGRVKMYFAGIIPDGQAPVDLYFATEEGCEAFRVAHPTYTKPDQVCVAVEQLSVPAAPTNCDRQRRVLYDPRAQRGICWR